jgi:hypothetical protein
LLSSSTSFSFFSLSYDFSPSLWGDRYVLVQPEPICFAEAVAATPGPSMPCTFALPSMARADPAFMDNLLI